jgi:hypothetical protein
MAGTSQAAPHAAGALAVLRAAFPAETAGELIARLQKSGAQIADARNGLTFPRLDLVAASAAPPARLPLAAVRIQKDDIFVQPTGAPLVALCLSDGPLCVEGWQPFVPQLALGGRAAASLRVWARDANGAESMVPLRAQLQ